MTTFLTLLSAYGVTYIVTESYIFSGLRNFFTKINPNFLGKLITCPLCAGFWVGILYCYFVNQVIESNTPIVNYIINGSLYGITSLIFYHIQERIKLSKKEFIQSIYQELTKES